MMVKGKWSLFNRKWLQVEDRRNRELARMEVGVEHLKYTKTQLYLLDSSSSETDDFGQNAKIRY